MRKRLSDMMSSKPISLSSSTWNANESPYLPINGDPTSMRSAKTQEQMELVYSEFVRHGGSVPLWRLSDKLKINVTTLSQLCQYLKKDGRLAQDGPRLPYRIPDAIETRARKAEATIDQIRRIISKVGLTDSACVEQIRKVIGKETTP